MYTLCGPGISSTKFPAISTRFPRCVNEMNPRTVLPLLGESLATPMGPASSVSLNLAGVSPQPATSAAATNAAATANGNPERAARAGVARGLRLEVVGILVDHNRLADDIGRSAADGDHTELRAKRRVATGVGLQH